MVPGRPVLGLAVIAGLTACSSGAAGSDPAPSAGVGSQTANVTITAAKGCEADRTTFPAGGVTFKITNKDATAVSEVELLSGERILAEKENIPAGLSGEFAVDVGAGTYTLYCPGAVTERSPITV